MIERNAATVSVWWRKISAVYAAVVGDRSWEEFGKNAGDVNMRWSVKGQSYTHSPASEHLFCSLPRGPYPRRVSGYPD